MNKQGKMKTLNEKSVRKNLVMIIALIIIVFAISAVTFVLTRNLRKEKTSVIGDSELLRAMTYDQLTEDDSLVYKEGTQGTENEEIVDSVKFSTFFLRDIDGDGYVEKLNGTCKEVGKDDTLYMEIIVQTEGYLKDGKIEINGKNFYMQTALPKDNELKSNYIGNDIKQIEFENLNNGTQKMLTGIVRSGDYTYDSQKTKAIGNNINNYSRNDNKIVLTGTYVADDGTETSIRKEVPITMDWYGTVTASFGNTSQTSYDILNRIDEEHDTIKLNFTINPYETKNKLNINYNYVEGYLN